MNAQELIAEQLPGHRSGISPEMPLTDLDGWDSLKGVRFILRMEQLAGRELSEGEIEKIVSVGDVELFLSSI